MKLTVAWIGKTKEAAIKSLTEEYLKRIHRFTPSEGAEFASEDALLKLGERGAHKATGRTRPVLVLLDQRGRQITSEDLAQFVSDQQERGTQRLIFAIGPADGFSEESRREADLILGFGKITMAHELARVVLLEQIYRAFTILKGHPYHTGH